MSPSSGGAAPALVLSPVSASVCGGRWLPPEDCLFVLWRIFAGTSQSGPHRLRALSQARVPRLAVAMGVGLACSRGARAVLAATFGPELLVVPQVCEEALAWRKWALGSVLLLVPFVLSSGGLLSSGTLLRSQVALAGFTLLFQCELPACFSFPNVLRGPGRPREFSPLPACPGDIGFYKTVRSGGDCPKF